MNKNEPQELALDDVRRPASDQLALHGANPIAPMIEAITKAGVTPENMGVLERMVTLYERQEERNAERLFNSAFAAMQKDLPHIVATTIIPNRGKYEKYEDVMRQIQPHLTQHGFSVSFSADYRENRIFQTCKLSHEGGHSQSNTFAVRLGGMKADSEAQADCKAATTAKRNALLNALNIVIRQDAYQDENGADATIEGEFIDFYQVQYLKERVKETNSDEAVFLEYAGAKKYEEISKKQYDRLIIALKNKESKEPKNPKS